MSGRGRGDSGPDRGDARRSVDAERAAGFTAARDGVADAAEALVAEGRRTAAEIDDRARQRLPEHVDRLVGSALTEAGAR